MTGHCYRIVLALPFVVLGILPLSVFGQTITWRASMPASDCNGPLDSAGNLWYAPSFDDSSWTALSLPISGSIPAQEDRYFRGTVMVDGRANATISFDSDDGISVYVNGTFKGQWGGQCHSGGCVGHPGGCGSSQVYVDISSDLVPGPNVLAFHVSNSGGGSYANLYFTSFSIISPPLDLLRPAADSFCQPTCLFDWAAGAASVSKYVLYTDGVVKKDNIPSGVTQYALAVSEALSEGPHAWTVQGCSNGTCTQSPNTFTVNIDATPPAPFELTDPPDQAWRSEMSGFSFIWAPTSDGASVTPSGLGGYELEVDGYIAGSTIATQTSLDSKSAAIPSHLTDGTHSWQVIALDKVGSRTATASRTVRIDSVPPSFPPYAPVPANGMWVVNPMPTLQWGLPVDNGSGIASQRLELFRSGEFDAGASATSFTFPMPLADGLHYWWIRAFDQAGNSTDSIEYSFGVDTTGPTGPELDGISGTADGAVVSSLTPKLCWFAASDAASGVGGYRLYVNGTLVRDNIAPSVSPPCTTPPQPLGDGTYQWQVEAFDNVGNTSRSLATFAFTVDTQPPDAFTLVAPANGTTLNEARPTFSWTASADRGSGLDHYELSLDDGAGGICMSPCVVPAAQTTFAPSTDLGVGQHTWFVTAVDKSGRKTQAGPQAFRLVATPTPTLTGTDTATPTASVTATATRTSTGTATRTATAMGTATSTGSFTPTTTFTNTRTPTATATESPMPTATATPTSTFAASATSTTTPTATDSSQYGTTGPVSQRRRLGCEADANVAQSYHARGAGR